MYSSRPRVPTYLSLFRLNKSFVGRVGGRCLEVRRFPKVRRPGAVSKERVIVFLNSRLLDQRYATNNPQVLFVQSRRVFPKNRLSFVFVEGILDPTVPRRRGLDPIALECKKEVGDF